MCDNERPSVCHEYRRKARVDHDCCECGETIKRGEEYSYTSGVWGGRGASFKTCLRCVGVRNWYEAECLPHYECKPAFTYLYEEIGDGGWNMMEIPELTEAARAAGYL